MEPHTGLNNLDFVVLGIILLSGLLALMRGFAREVLSLAVWIASYFVAAHYFPLAEPYVHQFVKSPSLVTDIAAVTVFCVAFVILSLISFFIARFVKGDALTAIDRSLGFLFGLVRGVLVVCLIYLIAAAIFWPDIDKAEMQSAAPQLDQQAATTPTSDPAAPPVEKPKDRGMPPALLMQARTRPYLAYGAEWLKQFVPEKKVAASAQYLDKKNEPQHMLDQKLLDNLSMPGIGTSHPDASPSYDDKSRSNLNQLIDQKANP